MRREERRWGGEFQVNSPTTSDQSRSSVSLDAYGDFVVVWDSNGSSGGDTSSYSIQGQRFLVTGELGGRVFFDADANGLQDGGIPDRGGDGQAL